LADALVIRLPANPTHPVDWVRVSAADGTAGAVVQGELEYASQLATACRVIALVPASQVLRVSTHIPLSGAAKIRQSLPFALEEQLAGDVEAQHFACGAKDSNNQVPAAVVDREQLSSWLSELREQQIVPAGVYAASDALPIAPAAITVLLDQDQAIIRNASGELATVDEESMQATLELLLDQQVEELENDVSIVPINLLVYCDRAAHDRHAELWSRLQMRVQDVDIRILENGALPLLAAQIATKGGVNLLQGSFAPKTELPLRWQEWRVSAILLVALLTLGIALKGAEFLQLKRTNAALDAAASQILQSTFPGAAGAADPWNELRTLLGPVATSEAKGTAVFAEALHVLSKAFAETPGIKMDSLSFRSGELNLQFTAPDVAAMDKLSQLIGESKRFSAEIQSANPENDVIKGRILIAEAGAP